MQEFFVVRRYRRRGVGRSAAFRVLGIFQKRWEIRGLKQNIAAEKFWETIIGEYTLGKYKKLERDDDIWQGAIFSLTTT